MSYKRVSIYLFISIIIGICSLTILRFSSESAMFFLILMLLINGLYICVLPLSSYSLNDIGYDFLEKNLPYCLLALILPFMLKPMVPIQFMLYSLLVLLTLNILLFGFYILISSFCNTIVAQIITILGFLVLIGGVFLVPAFTAILDNYDQKYSIYQIFVQINPIIVICNIFDVDPFHKEQLYHLFGSSYLVPKTNVFKSLMLWGLASALIWMVYFFWLKKPASQMSEVKN